MIPRKRSNLLQATINSIRGLACLVKEPSAKRALFVLIGSLFAYRYHPSFYLELIILLMGIGLALEAVNTAIEKLSDLVEPNFSLTIKEIKDLGSSSFMIILILIGLIILKILWLEMPIH